MSIETIAQRAFMETGGQTTENFNWQQAQLYARLVEEEYSEFAKAHSRVDKQQGAIDALELTEMIDGAVDLVVVAKGFLLSLGVNPQDVMREVWDTNLAKVGKELDVSGELVRVIPVPGVVLKRREDGKLLKPDGWKPPDFAKFNPLLRTTTKPE